MGWGERKRKPLSDHYVINRGKIHLSQGEDEGRTFCGIDLGDVNHYTMEMSDTTCQKCLMVKTSDWGKHLAKTRGRGRGRRSDVRA